MLTFSNSNHLNLGRYFESRVMSEDTKRFPKALFSRLECPEWDDVLLSAGGKIHDEIVLGMQAEFVRAVLLATVDGRGGGSGGGDGAEDGGPEDGGAEGGAGSGGGGGSKDNTTYGGGPRVKKEGEQSAKKSASAKSAARKSKKKKKKKRGKGRVHGAGAEAGTEAGAKEGERKEGEGAGDEGPVELEYAIAKLPPNATLLHVAVLMAIEKRVLIIYAQRLCEFKLLSILVFSLFSYFSFLVASVVTVSFV